MSNEHNPIAQRINYMQQYWTEQRLLHPEARFVCWSVEEPDIPLINGFLKLESSPYGKIEETLILMFTDFESEATFSYALARDWLAAYQKDSETYPELQWPAYPRLQEDFKTLAPDNSETATRFLLRLLTEFKAYEGKPSRLFLGIHPRKVADYTELSLWICQLLEQLPKTIGILVVDYITGNFYEKVFSHPDALFAKQTLRLKNQDIQGAYAQLMTRGNPNDPQVAFRKCKVNMAEAASNKQKEALIAWGERGLVITRQTKNLPFWASAYLIYAGFLFGFKDTERILYLLDKGIKIGEKAPGDRDLLKIILHLHAYKAGYYSILNKKNEALACYLQQATLARQQHEPFIAITAYKNAILLAGQHHKMHKVQDQIPEAFQCGYALEDDLLKTTEFFYIARHYLTLLQEQEQTPALQQKEASLRERLSRLFGQHWETKAKNIKKQMKHTALVT